MDLAKSDRSRDGDPSRSGGSDRRLGLALVKRIVFEEVWYWYEAILGVLPGRLGRLLRIFAYWPILPRAVNIGEFSHIRNPSRLRAGKGVGIGRDCRITCTGGLTLGDDVILGPNVTIVTNNHTFSELDRPIRLQRTEAAPITIEDDVWLGAGVIVAAGVTIGRGAVVAAGAVVTRDVAPYDVVVGVPARRVANRRAD